MALKTMPIAKLQQLKSQVEAAISANVSIHTRLQIVCRSVQRLAILKISVARGTEPLFF
jgi:hypothetical protein